ncbi:Uncharacterized protein TCM_008876 [Theobroma cacao]|uniref:Uncharacterized protein n=1 Tax=Theobroma cacao TaxID=3641 RepID=A0A061EC81_THECC|nr:Uncharacterized protein TCM_008876 [Theobroma cacao]
MSVNRDVAAIVMGLREVPARDIENFSFNANAKEQEIRNNFDEVKMYLDCRYLLT